MKLPFLFNPFSTYSERVRTKTRFGHDKESREFIAEVLQIARTHTRSVGVGERFWRAQLGPERFVSKYDDCGEWMGDYKHPYPEDRMRPSSEFVKNGRANPAGIAYWYVATDPTTAIAEMRPWQGATLTVAEIQANRSLQIIDCGSTHPMIAPLHPVKPSTRERFIWNSIGEAFSRPIDPGAIDVDYVPTQILAEAFKMEGFDGIQYKSHLGNGNNLTVFELDAFAIVELTLWTTRRVSYDLECNGEYIEEH
ncbi:MAG: RES family NAD+ phosphorylase [Acidobacteria bacterium]|nr:RES family NAD+ phosphorylase [Acidobacteriota bacterium]